MVIDTFRDTPSQRGFARSLLVVGLVVAAALFLWPGSHRADAAAVGIKSGVSGYCLDNYRNGSADGNKVVLWGCNESAAQNWTVTGGSVVHGTACLTASATASGSPIVSEKCSSDNPNQVWLKDGNSLLNPNSTLCLTAPGPHEQLQLAACGSGSAANQTWSFAASQTCSGTEGERVACYAEKQWAIWQSGTVSHSSLLNKYTDNASYEAWCADFVSYVYREAGYPFTGAYDNWDENNANNVQNYGFTMHMADSGYVPKTGDVAYFDYAGGHVEIVVRGGKTPTFVYGNSGETDPTTGNGQMKANTVVDDGSAGKLIYYLTPN